MSLYINGEPTEGKLYSVGYKNDMMDGVLIDTPGFYGHLSDHEELDREIMEGMEDEPMEHFYIATDVDWEEVPHCWILRSITSKIITTAEQVCAEACE